jgi:hypothetical protein
MHDTNASIVAQVILKGTVELSVANPTLKREDLAAELIGIYKSTYNSLLIKTASLNPPVETKKTAEPVAEAPKAPIVVEAPKEDIVASRMIKPDMTTKANIDETIDPTEDNPPTVSVPVVPVEPAAPAVNKPKVTDTVRAYVENNKINEKAVRTAMVKLNAFKNDIPDDEYTECLSYCHGVLADITGIL